MPNFLGGRATSYEARMKDVAPSLAEGADWVLIARNGKEANVWSSVNARATEDIYRLGAGKILGVEATTGGSGNTPL